MSRARRSMHLYTDSIDGLRQAVCRTGERLSAVEFANDADRAFAKRGLRLEDVAGARLLHPLQISFERRLNVVLSRAEDGCESRPITDHFQFSIKRLPVHQQRAREGNMWQ
jgi:hypothetical protein